MQHTHTIYHTECKSIFSKFFLFYLKRASRLTNRVKKRRSGDLTLKMCTTQQQQIVFRLHYITKTRKCNIVSHFGSRKIYVLNLEVKIVCVCARYIKRILTGIVYIAPNLYYIYIYIDIFIYIGTWSNGIQI